MPILSKESHFASGSEISSIMNHVVLSCFPTRNDLKKNGQYNRQNDRSYAVSRQTSTEDMGTRPEHKFSFKVIV